MNNWSIVGRVGRDAETRHTPNGKQVARWTVAVDHGWGENKQTIWVDCNLWGERGAKLAGHIRKGDRIGVVGEMGTREHEGKTYIQLDVRDVTLLSAKRESRDTDGAPF